MVDNDVYIDDYDDGGSDVEVNGPYISLDDGDRSDFDYDDHDYNNE